MGAGGWSLLLQVGDTIMHNLITVHFLYGFDLHSLSDVSESLS